MSECRNCGEPTTPKKVAYKNKETGEIIRGTLVFCSDRCHTEYTRARLRERGRTISTFDERWVEVEA